MTRTASLAGVLLTILVLAGCGDDTGSGLGDQPGAGPDTSAPTGLEDRDWLSTQVTVGDKDRPLEPGTTIVVAFDDSAVSASAGCNHLSGSARWQDGALLVEDMGGTEMGCPAPLMRQDEWLADFLTSRPQVAVDGDEMTMESGKTTVSLVDREAAMPDTELEGTAWRLQSIGEAGPDGGVSSVPGGVRSTLRIDDGSLGVHPGCNTGGGDVEITDDALVVDAVFTTQMACPGARQQVEDAVLDVLQGRVEYRVEGDTLTLTRDGRMLVYRAVS